ncbi:hypothetical protein EVG20_g11498 [Dentipellis fragilis]|uniref:Uncharacterized protein n=1 Tax=Dentipellis fragilis TaxID=205917 RepID=A0A4Y9XL88_9AGAM|nr:hypothetical protein EVG20_g11498 [Dentipellis fragilis]
MANMPRFAKDGNKWNPWDLEAFNIKIKREDAATFFGTDDLPMPAVDEEFLKTPQAKDMVHDNNAELLYMLETAMEFPLSGQSAVADFAVQLLRHLGYVKRSRVACTRMDFESFVCGQWKRTTSDVCLIDRLQHNDVRLLVQEDERFDIEHMWELEPQLIASAIAAFELTNREREWRGEATVDSGVCPSFPSRRARRARRAAPLTVTQVIPGIILFGSRPSFFKIPVTSSLWCSVREGTYPTETTTVSMHVPILPNPSHRDRKAMKAIENRGPILRTFEAFKSVLGI